MKVMLSAAVVGMALASLPGAAVATGERCPRAWRAMELPPGSATSLNGVSGSAVNDVWAVGSSAHGAVAVHWRGDKPEIERIPRPARHGTTLNSVLAFGPDDVFAVGEIAEAGKSKRPWAVHRDARGWTTLTLPKLPRLEGRGRELYAIDGISSDDVWAVGEAHPKPTRLHGGYTLIAHWDGREWRLVPAPRAGSGPAFLTDVDAVSKNDVWTVGMHKPRSGRSPILVMHWDGRRWTHIPGPASRSYGSPTVAAYAPGRVWVGFGQAAARWTGRRWVTQRLPSGTGVHAIAMTSSRTAVAVGWRLTGAAASIVRWRGGHWTSERSPAVSCPRCGEPSLYNVVALDTTDVWAVGEASRRYATWSALVERYSCGK